VVLSQSALPPTLWDAIAMIWLGYYCGAVSRRMQASEDRFLRESEI
jgi:hypothetical protein